MKVKPLGDRVLVRRTEEESLSKGGIIIPETAKEKPIRGIVAAAGPGERQKEGDRRPMAVKEGDKVIFGKYAGTEIKIEGEEYLIVRESEILAVID
ncbi:MAG: co-chaperone GroES [Bradymonadales bacterium]|nr:co-chaperone GroES [Bradymonadales bacterium]